MIKNFHLLNKKEKRNLVLFNNNSAKHLSILSNDNNILKNKKSFIQKMRIKKKLLEKLSFENKLIRDKNSLNRSLSNSNFYNQLSILSLNNSPIKTEFKRKKVLKSNDHLNKDLNLLSLTFQKPEIFNLNHKLFYNGIYNSKNEIQYSKQNLDFIDDYYYKKDLYNEKKSIQLNKLFERKKKDIYILPSKSELNMKSSKENKEFNSILKQFKENQNKKLKKKSIKFANQIEEMLITDNIINHNIKLNQSPKEKTLYSLQKKIEFNNLLYSKKRLIDLDLDELNNNLNKVKVDNFKIDIWQNNYPKFLKTKFKRSTILKFGSYGGLNNETSI